MMMKLPEIYTCRLNVESKPRPKPVRSMELPMFPKKSAIVKNVSRVCTFSDSKLQATENLNILPRAVRR